MNKNRVWLPNNRESLPHHPSLDYACDMKPFWAALCFFGTVLLSWAAGPDDQFIRISDLIDQADTLQQNGQSRTAYDQYVEAQAKLKQFQTAYPSWNPKTIQFRLDQLNQKLAPLAARFDAPPAKPATPLAAPPKSPANDPSGQFQRYEERIRQLEADKTLLQAKLQEALVARSPAVSQGALTQAEQEATRLAKENAVLKSALENLRKPAGAAAGSKAPPAISGGSSAMMTNQPASPPARAAASWQKEKVSLEKELRAMREADQQNQKALDGLRHENSRLKAKVEELSARPNRSDKNDKARNRDQETGRLRRQLALLEAEKIPYTAEEEAVLKKGASAPALSQEEPPKRKPPKPVPAAAAALMADARQAFNNQRYPEAEAKYAEVLKLDSDNPSIRANLAAIQIEENHLAEAETNLNLALAQDREDPFVLSMVGYLRLRQSRYDEAIDALTRAAAQDNQNADVQNYLGIALMEKGLRGPAETALRRALQISPGFARAHHNLAFIYATQKPPLLELANWHYDKALAAGHPPNPELEKLLGRAKAGE